MEVWPSILPVWNVGYSSEYKNAVIRTQLNGRKAQRLVSQRNSEIVNVSIRLYGAELPLFEYFAQSVLNDGQDFFTGIYLDNGVTESGKMRIVGGKYTVSAISTLSWSVSCSIEVVRDHA